MKATTNDPIRPLMDQMAEVTPRPVVDRATSDAEARRLGFDLDPANNLVMHRFAGNTAPMTHELSTLAGHQVMFECVTALMCMDYDGGPAGADHLMMVLSDADDQFDEPEEAHPHGWNKQGAAYAVRRLICAMAAEFIRTGQALPFVRNELQKQIQVLRSQQEQAIQAAIRPCLPVGEWS